MESDETLRGEDVVVGVHLHDVFALRYRPVRSVITFSAVVNRVFVAQSFEKRNRAAQQARVLIGGVEDALLDDVRQSRGVGEFDMMENAAAQKWPPLTLARMVAST